MVGCRVTWLLGGPLSPLGWNIGFLESPIDVVLQAIKADDSSKPAVKVRWCDDYPGCLRALLPFEAPWTRQLLIRHGPWTAYLNNFRNGGDPFYIVNVLSRQLRCHGVVAVHQPRTAVGHASTQFRLMGPEGEPPLQYIRQLAAHAEDGRWQWVASGNSLPFEDRERYTRRLIRERLTREMLMAYLQALGIMVDDPRAFGESVLITQPVRWKRTTKTLDEARARWKLDSSVVSKDE
jgi:hypothetical protein